MAKPRVRNERMISTMTYFDAATLDKLDQFTLDRREEFRSRSEVIRAAVEEYLEKRGYE